MTINLLGLDFETFGTRDLTKVGLYNYMEDPKFTVLIAGTCSEYGGNHGADGFLNFLDKPEESREKLFDLLNESDEVAAHNAAFEAGVLRHLGAPKEFELKLVDSAVIASCLGAGRSLAQASAQLRSINKMEEGKAFIKRFCIPHKDFDFECPTMEKIQSDQDMASEWMVGIQYCELDAHLSASLVAKYGMPFREADYYRVTQSMNQLGWHVDLPAVQSMKYRYEENLEAILADFQDQCDPNQELNLNSLPQLKAWCAARGVRATSFDEKHVEKLLRTVDKRLRTIGTANPKYHQYWEVFRMLETKQALGGSSLKKLDTILQQTGEDGLLRDQYLHCGAGQTYRTTGRGVQMQNLKRLSSLIDMSKLGDLNIKYTNEELAENLRQVFTSRYENGLLFVGDFSSVESRGLAYLAGEQWKLDAYAQGKDLYKVLASKIYGVDYDEITSDQRRTGKVGELACGYGAGAGAVQTFAEKMGTPMSEAEAGQLVKDWRAANDSVVDLWHTLDDLLRSFATSGERASAQVAGNRFILTLRPMTTPGSLYDLHPGCHSMVMELWERSSSGSVILERVFHGVHLRGRDVGYYKPGATKNGPLWVNTFRNPKTGLTEHYKLYGGKLTGILTQSFCREIFFLVAVELYCWTKKYSGTQLIGQFHDELVVDVDMDKFEFVDPKNIKDAIHTVMTASPFPDFPLEAEVKYDYRYIK